MPDPVAYALLIVVAIAYLGGAVLVVAALAKVLLAWSERGRIRRGAEPVDQALQQRAAAATAAVAELANIAAPGTDVVAILGAPTGDADRVVGDGGLAVTRFRAGHPATRGVRTGRTHRAQLCRGAEPGCPRARPRHPT
jgi:hypothetical protein